jgi:hypothetical protein
VLRRPSCGRVRTYSSPVSPPTEGSIAVAERPSPALTPTAVTDFLPDDDTSLLMLRFAAAAAAEGGRTGLAAVSDPTRRRGSGGGDDDDATA